MTTDTSAPPDPAARQAEPVAWRQVTVHSAYEAVLTAILLFCVVTLVRWLIGPSALSRSVPQIHLELLLVGSAVGLLLAGLILSPLGRASGGHMNPAVSFGMWLLGVFPGRAVIPYTIGQLVGSLVGVLAARVLWGPPVVAVPVAYAVLRPEPGLSNAGLFPAEAAGTAVILLLVALFLSEPRLTQLVPWLVGLLVAAAITGLGTITGASLDPAREFGPALFAEQPAFLVSYLLAPLVGAAAAAWLIRRLRRMVRTHHLSGRY